MKAVFILFGLLFLTCALVSAKPRRNQKQKSQSIDRLENLVEKPAADEVEVEAADERCQRLYDSFMPLRDAALDFIEVYPDAQPYVQYIQMSVNFPMTSDSHWRTLWCNVAEAKNFRQLGRALNIMIPPKQLFEIADHFKQVIFELEEGLPEYIRYNTDMRKWLNKTGFPEQWPLVNTNEEEVVNLMREGQFGDQRNLILLGADPRNLALERIAEILLDSQGVEEYVVRLGSEWLVESTGVLATNMDWLKLMANEGKMELYYDTLFKLFDFTRTLDDLGILELI